MSCRSLLVLALLLVLPAPAAAFNSSCYTEDGEHCSHFDGYEAPRSRWYHDDLTPGSTDAEHAQIWIRAAEVSGLPPELLDEFRLRHFSSDEVLPWSEAVTNPTGLMSVMTFSGIADREYQSWAPVSFAPDSIRDRTHTIAEFSQLPDFSWALWDWAQGNETCPAVDGLEPDICHLFAEHLGSLNSSHFLPQGADWYAHYHDLALDRSNDLIWACTWGQGTGDFEPRAPQEDPEVNPLDLCDLARQTLCNL